MKVGFRAEASLVEGFFEVVADIYRFHVLDAAIKIWWSRKSTVH
jgi:hypothetical protein